MNTVVVFDIYSELQRPWIFSVVSTINLRLQINQHIDICFKPQAH